MGTSEDERIRHKNRHYNEAADMYQGMKEMGFSHADIMKHAKDSLEKSIDSSRSDVYRAMINMDGSLDEDSKQS